MSEPVSSPEIALASAVITRAVFDLVEPKKKLVEEAKRWIFDSKRGLPGYSLYDLCEILDIQISLVRKFAKLLIEVVERDALSPSEKKRPKGLLSSLTPQYLIKLLSNKNTCNNIAA